MTNVQKQINLLNSLYAQLNPTHTTNAIDWCFSGKAPTRVTKKLKDLIATFQQLVTLKAKYEAELKEVNTKIESGLYKKEVIVRRISNANAPLNFEGPDEIVELEVATCNGEVVYKFKELSRRYATQPEDYKIR